jgi:hypothetical protein
MSLHDGRRFVAEPAAFRPWREGDSPVCAHASVKARLMPPCRPPVLVVDRALLGAPRPAYTRVESLCAMHAAGRFLPTSIGKLCHAAELRARQTILERHDDELQELLAAEAVDVLAQVRAALPELLRAMLPAAALAAIDQQQEASP